MKAKFLRFNLYLGILALIAGTVMLALALPFMKTWFYSFAWWGFILALDSINYRRQKTSLLAKPADFVFLASVSVFIWLIFELFNLRLRNWTYHGLPTHAAVRWPGYFLAFATVVPALVEISQFAGSFLKPKVSNSWKVKITPRLLNLGFGGGFLFLALGLICPRLAFPLVWLGFVLIFEPTNYRASRPSFLKDLENGSRRNVRAWLAAGFAAGIIWELFNYWAGSHWEYSLPYLNCWRIFQMPVFGYLGFLPFALEIFGFVQFLAAIREKLRRKPWAMAAATSGLLAFYAVGFALIDKFTLVP